MNATDLFALNFAAAINEALANGVPAAVIVNTLELAKAQIIQRQLIASQKPASAIVPAIGQPPRFTRG